MSAPFGNVLLTTEKDQKIVIEFLEMLLSLAVDNFNEGYGTDYSISDYEILPPDASGGYVISAIDPSNTNTMTATVVSSDIINLVFSTTLTPVQPTAAPSTSYYPGEANPGGYGYDGSVS